MKSGILSQLLTDGIFCSAKKANEALCKSFKNTWQGKITIKVIGVQKKKKNLIPELLQHTTYTKDFQLQEENA